MLSRSKLSIALKVPQCRVTRHGIVYRGLARSASRSPSVFPENFNTRTASKTQIATMATETTAIVSREYKKPASLETIHLDAPNEDEVLIDCHYVGICHTDVAVMNGSFPTQKLPAVFGHEGAGVVIQAGSNVKTVAKGDKVLLSFAHCGSCGQCKDSHPAYCDTFIPRNFSSRRPDGSTGLKLGNGEDVSGSFFGQSSFASQALVHKNSLVKVPADTPLEIFAPIGCGQITGAGTVFNVLDVQSSDSLAVFGCGGVGLACVMAAKIRKAKQIIVVDLVQSRLDLAKELGATHVIGGEVAKDKDKLVAEFHKLCPPNGPPYAIDTSGVPGVINNMLDIIGTRGRAITLGSPPVEQTVQITPAHFLLAGRTYQGVTEGDSIPEQIIPYLIEQHRKGNYPVDKLIKYYPAKDFQKAIDDMHSGVTIKPVLRWKD